MHFGCAQLQPRTPGCNANVSLRAARQTSHSSTTESPTGSPAGPRSPPSKPLSQGDERGRVPLVVQTEPPRRLRSVGVRVVATAASRREQRPRSVRGLRLVFPHPPIAPRATRHWRAHGRRRREQDRRRSWFPGCVSMQHVGCGGRSQRVRSRPDRAASAAPGCSLQMEHARGVDRFSQRDSRSGGGAARSWLGY